MAGLFSVLAAIVSFDSYPIAAIMFVGAVFLLILVLTWAKCECLGCRLEADCKRDTDNEFN